MGLRFIPRGRTARSLGLFLVGLLVIAIVIFVMPGVSWRAQVIGLKVQGSLPELSWTELFRMLRPPYYIRDIVSTKSPYQSVQNPYSSKTDVERGEEIFRSQCSGCHGLEGAGGSASSLTQTNYSRGNSDWALFRTISRGVPGTAMEGRTLPEVAIWQVVGYVRSLTQGSNKANPQENPVNGDSMPDSISPSPVSYERLLQADDQPGNWLTYSGTYNSHRYSRLAQINRGNAKALTLEWVFQMPTIETVVETSPLVVDRVMFLTEPPNNVWAIETRTGQPLWSYKRSLPEKMPLCCGRVNRGLAILGGAVYLGTLDAHLVALNSRTGQVLWDVEVADYRSGYSLTGAPLAVRDKIIVGIAGGENGIRGFLDAYDAVTGRRIWRFHTVPGPGEAGNETWEGDSWKRGGGPTWLTGSFDAELNLIYWGVGNPGPNFQGDVRKGDNLYSNCVIALNADTGKLKWYFQFTPHDEHDWDAVQIPVLVDIVLQDQPRKLLLWANRNAFYYLLDRTTGKFLLAREFAKQTWAERIDAKGHPVLKPHSVPSSRGTLLYPGVTGATNWWSPSYNPLTNLFYVPVLEKASIFFKGRADLRTGEITEGSAGTFEGSATQPLANEAHWTAVRALLPQTGELKWEYKLPPRTTWGVMGGILSTAGHLVFGGDHKLFFALDAYSGTELWRAYLGGEIIAAPVTYLSEGRQHVAIAAGRAVFAFGLDKN